ncbi:MAG: hypothetical protein U0176_14055 [Bacteroidia bacterium]
MSDRAATGGSPWNTLVTWVLIREEVWKSDLGFEIHVSKGGLEIATIHVKRDLFKLDLSEIAQPSDTLDFFIEGKRMGQGWYRAERRFSKRLHDAQNIALNLRYYKPRNN